MPARRVASLVASAAAWGALLATRAVPAGTGPAEILIDDRDVYPESLTSTRAGDLIVGSIKGNLYRAAAGADKASVWVRPDSLNGLQSVFGVLADERAKLLWVCSVPNPFQAPVPGAVAELVALDLATGQLRSRHAFPPPRSVCNDMTVAKDGSVYASDTQNGRILRLAGGKGKLEAWGADDSLKGIDGIAFAADGTLYANNVQKNTLLRIDIAKDGHMGPVTVLKIDEKLGGPDGMRLVSGHRFLLAEGTTGRISEVTLSKDSATLRPLRVGLTSSPGVTLVGKTAYAIEGKIGYLVDPALRGKDPGPFKIYAIPLNAGSVK